MLAVASVNSLIQQHLHICMNDDINRDQSFFVTHYLLTYSKCWQYIANRPSAQMACRCCSSNDSFISAATAGPGWSSIGPSSTQQQHWWSRSCLTAEHWTLNSTRHHEACVENRKMQHWKMTEQFQHIPASGANLL